MGTKRANIEDPSQLLPGPATPDRGCQSTEWISREARPQAGTKSRAKRDREARRDREMHRMWEKARGEWREMEQDQRERERLPTFSDRAKDTEWRERDRRREEGRHSNGRIASVQEYDEHREREREKGDTFPRTRRRSNEQERGPRLSIGQDNERLLKRNMERLRELDKSEKEREREKAKKRDVQRYREVERPMEYERARVREEMKRNGGGRLEEESNRVRERGWETGRRERRRERDTEVNDQQITRVREVDREKARHRDREDWLISPQRLRIKEGERGNFSDREERDERSRAGWKERHRHTKSEGDSDGEREVRSKKTSESPRFDQIKRDHEREKTKEKLRDRERRREIEWQRERDMAGYRRRERDKELTMDRYTDIQQYREKEWIREERGPERQRIGMRDIPDRKREKEPSEKIRENREREIEYLYPCTAEREVSINPERREKERDRRRSWDVGQTERSSQTQREALRKMQMEGQSSGRWKSGSDEEREQSRRKIKDFYEDKERERGSDSDREKKAKRSEEEQDIPRGQSEGGAREGLKKEELDTENDREGEKSESKQRSLRQMWLEPRSGGVRTESLEEEFRERERARERYVQRYKERTESSNSTETQYERKTISLEDKYRQLERAGEFMKDVNKENIEERRKEDGGTEPDFNSEVGIDAPLQTDLEKLEDNMEVSEREEEKASGRYSDSEGEEGSEREWEVEWRERVTSGDDGFVTVSSGGDEDEAEEDKFEDCKEFWDGGVREDLTRQSLTRTHLSEGEIETKMTEEKSDRTVTVFCVVGQTLPRSGSNQNVLMDPVEQDDTSQHPTQNLVGSGEIDQDAPIRDAETSEESIKESSTEAEKENISHSVMLSVEEITSNHDTEQENADCDELTKEVTSSQDLEFTGSMSAEKNTQPHPLESSETTTHTEDHGSTQKKMTGGENGEEETCNTEEGRKRYSAAPHVKWAKNVLKEILGSSDDGTLNVPEPSTQTEQPSDGVAAQGDKDSQASPLYGTVLKPRKHGIERKCLDTDLVQAKPEDTVNVSHLDVKMDGNKILINIERDSETEEDLQGLEQDKEGLEVYTDEEYDYDQMLPSPDLQSLSSEGEPEKEESSKKDEKQKKKKKTVWDVLSSSSLRDFGNEAWGRRKGFRKTIEKNEDAEGEGVARDRRPRVFTTEEEEYDDLRHSFNESELRNFKAKISRTRMRNSKFYNSQLYQQYSEVVQNREIMHQSHSDASSSIFGDVATISASSSPCPSPPPARRPLPPLPVVLHPHSLPQTNTSGVLAIRHDTSPRPSSSRLSKSFASSPMLWQELPGVRNSPELKNLSVDERRLQEVRFEVVTSEASYCSSLDIVVEHFVKCEQLNSLLTTQDKNWLFSRLCDVRAISHSFYTQLEERVESNIMHFTVCDIIIKHCPRFRAVYVPYLTNQSYQDKTYQRLMNENTGFRNTVEKLEHSPKCQRLPFRSFLILPFQRITRLKLLVQNIVKRTAPKTKDEAQAIKAMKLLEKMIQDSNDSISQMKSIESLLTLNAKVDFECKTLPLISQSRRLVREGPVTELREFSLKVTERSAYMHLFNDYLLLSLPKEGGRFTVIDHSPVSELRAENCRLKLHSVQKNVFRLYMGQKALLLRTETQADKLRWISAVTRPHPEIDFSAAQDIPQMQCIRAFVAQQPDELGLEKADVLLVHQQSSDGWVEGTRLSDRHRGWAPESHLETILSEKARQCNLVDTLKITAATATV